MKKKYKKIKNSKASHENYFFGLINVIAELVQGGRDLCFVSRKTSKGSDFIVFRLSNYGLELL